MSPALIPACSAGEPFIGAITYSTTQPVTNRRRYLPDYPCPGRLLGELALVLA